MNQVEKIEYVLNFLQKKIDEGFPYPFQVSYEDNHFMFQLRSGKKECCARLKQTEEVIACICGGNQEMIKEGITQLFNTLRAALEAQESTALSGCSDYEKVKNDLILRPLNYQLAKSELEDVPYIKAGDIALVLYVVIAHAGSDYFTAKMHRNQMKKWEKPESEVLAAALVNTYIMYPPRLYSVEDLLFGNIKPNVGGTFMVDGIPLNIKKSIRGYVLTNTLETNGAIAIFYPGVAKKIAECLGEDFYIAFTSVHDVHIHSASTITPNIIRNSLRDTNKYFNQKEDVLTNQVYCYSRERKSFGVIADGNFIEVYKDA